jgi:GntR family transcriptional regulator, transcriptional repressor for pyruvate dehydrogenase complex
MVKKNRSLILLEVIKESRAPIGSSYLSQKLNIPTATIGRVLRELESDGYILKDSNKGRIITMKGLQYLQETNIRLNKMESADRLIDFVEDSSREKLLEVLEVRKLLEVKSIELACINATDTELKELEEILYEQKYEIRRGGIGNTQDLQLHLLIAEMSRNKTIGHLLNVILTEDNAYTKFNIFADHIMNDQVDQHKKIVEAVLKRDVNSAKEEMENHLNHVIMDVEKYNK